MVKMTVETIRMSQKLVVLLHVVQDSFSVTILIVFFQCIFVIEMMTVEITLMNRIATIMNVMADNSNVLGTKRCLDFAYQTTEFVMGVRTVLEAKMKLIVRQKSVQ